MLTGGYKTSNSVIENKTPCVSQKKGWGNTSTTLKNVRFQIRKARLESVEFCYIILLTPFFMLFFPSNYES